MEAFVFLTFPELITVYNIARVLAPYKSYWAAMKKIFIYARPCVNKMTWAFFFTWVQSFRPAKLKCSFPYLWNMEETSEELPNFSIGIDLLGPHPTSNKNKAEKNSQDARFANLSEDQLQQILTERHSLGTKKVTNWSLITLKVKFPLLLLFLNLFNLGNKVHSC